MGRGIVKPTTIRKYKLLPSFLTLSEQPTNAKPASWWQLVDTAVSHLSHGRSLHSFTLFHHLWQHVGRHSGKSDADPRRSLRSDGCSCRDRYRYCFFHLHYNMPSCAECRHSRRFCINAVWKLTRAFNISFAFNHILKYNPRPSPTCCHVLCR